MRIITCVCGAVLVAACGTHKAELVRIVPVAANSDCQFGGTAIETGIDTNGDGVLEDSEVTATTYVCNPSAIVTCDATDVVYEGTVTVSADGDFAQLAGISCVDGDLIVSGLDGAQLQSLPQLATVTGSVVVAGNPSLESLDGFGSLRKIGANYVAEADPALTRVAALGQLTNFDTISLIDNIALTDLSGFDAFQELPQASLVINSNPALTSLHGLENLKSVQTLNVQSNATLTSLDALSNLTTAAVIDISGNPELPAVDLPRLQLATVRVFLNSDNSLATVSLPALSSLGGGLQLASDPALVSIDAPALIVTGNFLIQADTSLTNVSAPQLSFATGDVTFSHVPDLTTVDLTSLAAIGGSFSLQYLSALPNLNGFSQVSSIGQDVTFEACDALPSFDGLGAITTIPGNLTINLDPQLTTLDGLTTVTSIGGNLVITSNTLLPLSLAQAFARGVRVTGTVTVH